jgi:repressor LexA
MRRLWLRFATWRQAASPLKRTALLWVRVPVALKYSARQGQYLAFIYYYTKIHGIAPVEAGIQRYFSVSPPSVHQTILTLERRGLDHPESGWGTIDPAQPVQGGIATTGMRILRVPSEQAKTGSGTSQRGAPFQNYTS